MTAGFEPLYGVGLAGMGMSATDRPTNVRFGSVCEVGILAETGHWAKLPQSGHRRGSAWGGKKLFRGIA